MTNLEQARRRLEIAEACHTGATREEAGVLFRVSLSAVDRACKEWRVKPKRVEYGQSRERGIVHPSTFQIVAQLQQTTHTQMAIAEEAGLTHQRVSQIYQAAREAGIKFPNREKEKANAT